MGELMKNKIVLAGFSVLLFLFNSCENKKFDFFKSDSAKNNLPPVEIRRDSLSDSVFADATTKMEFRNEGIIYVYELVFSDESPEEAGDAWVKDFEGIYSATPEINLLKLKAEKLCFENQTMNSFETYVQKNLDATVSWLTNSLLEGTIEMDNTSQKYFMEVKRLSVESMGRAALDETVSYLYYLSEDGNQLTLVQKKSENPGAEEIVFSEDDSGEFQIDVYGNEIIIYPLTKLNSDGEREAVGDETISYTAFVEWMDGHKKFSGPVYKNYVLESEDKTFMKISKLDEISGSMSFSSEYTDGGESISGSTYVVKSEINFDKVPDELSDLTSASMAQDMVSMPFVFERM